jgi:hypothetical protein
MMAGMTPRADTGSHRVLWGLALAVIVLAAFFGGMLVERLRLDAKRDEVIQRYNRVLQEHREQQMRAEKAGSR